MTLDPTSIHRAANTVRIFFWLEILGLALASITYAIDPLSFIHPQLAIGGIASMTAVVILARIIPALRARSRLTHTLEVLSLFIYATLLTISTGATSSPFIGLYALALLAASLVWKLWQVLLLALATIAPTLLQSGFLDSMNDMYLLTTIMLLLNALAPATAAAIIIAKLHERITDLDRDAQQADSAQKERPTVVRATSYAAADRLNRRSADTELQQTTE
jgi:hypothetical protein